MPSRTTRVWPLCDCVSPGQLVSGDFREVGLVRPGGRKSRTDDRAGELGEHVVEAGLGLAGVPGGAAAVVGDNLLVVAVLGVPDDDQAVGDQAEGQGAHHRVTGTAARLPDPSRCRDSRNACSMLHRQE